MNNENAPLDDVESTYKTWNCLLCGFVYSERDGWPDEGIAPGTCWQDVPEDWVCPDCGASKSDFVMVEI
ncbi:rubredoxin [Bradyrhizobium sp. USDA 4518]